MTLMPAVHLRLVPGRAMLVTRLQGLPKGMPAAAAIPGKPGIPEPCRHRDLMCQVLAGAAERVDQP